MAATPFKGTLTIVGLRTGLTQQLPFSADDVNGNFVTFSKTNQTFWQVVGERVAITDLQLSAAGVDTSRLDLFINGADVNVAYRDNAVLDSRTYPRISRSLPIEMGASIQMKCVT